MGLEIIFAIAVIFKLKRFLRGKAKQLHLQYSLRSDIRFIIARIRKAGAKQESAYFKTISIVFFKYLLNCKKLSCLSQHLEDLKNELDKEFLLIIVFVPHSAMTVVLAEK